ncbi:MAG: GAF domain-containing sensor histidine kinase [Planctomycetota bacterium]
MTAPRIEIGGGEDDILELVDALLTAYESVEDPQRLLPVLLERLVEGVGLTRAAIETWSAEAGRRRWYRVRRLATVREPEKRGARPYPPPRQEERLLELSASLEDALLQGPLLLGAHPDGIKLLREGEAFAQALPLRRKGELVGLLLVGGGEGGSTPSPCLASSRAAARLTSVFLPAMTSERAFARFRRFEASIEREFRVSPEQRFRSIAEQVFPRARQLLGEGRLFLLAHERGRVRPLALSWPVPGLPAVWAVGPGSGSLLGGVLERGHAVVTEPSATGERLIAGNRSTVPRAEQLVLGDATFRLHPVLFEGRPVGLFGHELMARSAQRANTHRESARTERFFSALGQLVFYAGIYRDLLRDTHRVGLLSRAARRLREGVFNVDRELPSSASALDEGETGDGEETSLAELAARLRSGIDVLVDSFRHMVGFVETLFSVGIAGLQEDDDIRDYLKRVVSIISARLGYEKVVVLRAHPARKVLHQPVINFEPRSPEEAALIRGVEVDYSEGQRSAWAWVARNQRELYVPDAQVDSVETAGGEQVLINRALVDLFQTRSFLTVPLVSRPRRERGRELLGILAVASHAADPIRQSDLEVIRTVAGQVSLTLENASLRGEQRKLISEQQRDLERQRQELRESYYRLFRYERREFHVDLVAGLAHDLKNPLVAARQFLRILELDAGRLAERADHVTPDGLRAFATEIRGIAERVDGACLQVQENLRAIEHRITEAATEEPRVQSLDPARVLQAALDDIPRAVRLGVEIHRDIRPVPPLEAHPDGLRSLFMNLVVNAVESIPEEACGDVWVSLREVGGGILFVVEDNGRGIAPEHLGKVFSARFTTKPRSTGLGLAWVHRNVTQHLQGRIHVESGDLGRGVRTRFTVEIPVSRSESSHGAPRPDCG